MDPYQFLDKYFNFWSIVIKLLGGVLQVNINTETKLLLAGDRFKLKSNIENTEYGGTEGVSFLGAKLSKQISKIIN